MATVSDARRFPTLLPLVIANAVPVVGVLVLGWDLRSIMFVYWLETAVVVFHSELKIVTVGGPFTLVWLPVHLAMFSAFMSVHLTMILPLGPTPHGGGMFPPAVIEDLLKRTWGAGVGLFVSHGISFVVDFLGNGEYKRTTVNAEVAAPWKRIFVMHVTTIVGAWSVMLLAAPVGALVALSLLKIVVDAHGHVGERQAPVDAGAMRVLVPPATKIDGVLRLFGAFLIFCGVLMSVGVGGEVYRAARIRSQWPTVDAYVLDCRVRESAASRARDASHTVQCRFRYEAAGAEHVSTLSTHSTWNPETLAAMRRWVSGHRRGTIQPIHYDPSAPETIRLGEFGETIDPVLVGETLTAAGGFAGTGALLLLIAIWRARLTSRLQPAS